MLWAGKQAKGGWFCALCQEKEQNKGQKKSLGVQRRAEESGPLGRGDPTDGKESPMIKVSRWRWGGAKQRHLMGVLSLAKLRHSRTGLPTHFHPGI